MGTKDTLTTGLNETVAKKNTLNLDNYVKAAEDSFASNKEAEKSVINTTHDTAKTNTLAQHDKAVNDTKVAYESEYERNAVQKLINEKQVAEKMANLGITDSGLNRTQQTAVQLSYANQKGKIDLARQSAIDDLTLNLTSALSDIENSRSSALLESDEKWADRAYEEGRTNYNNDIASYDNQISSYVTGISDIEQAEIDAAADVQKAAISASAKNSDNTSAQKIYWFRGVAANGNYLYYNTDTGKNEEIPAYMNPYTSNDNRITYRAEYNDKDIGFFQLADGTTGYQPRGLVSEAVGEKKRFVKALLDDGRPVKYDQYGNGKQNTIWVSPKGNYFVWDDLENEYDKLTNEQFESIKIAYQKGE